MRSKALVSLVTLFLAVPMAAAQSSATGKSSLKPITTTDWDTAAAAHLLGRAGFGGTPAEIEALATLTLDQAVDSLVDFEKTTWRNAPPLISDELNEGRDREKLRTMTVEERKAYQDMRQKQAREGMEELRLWWIERMVESERPFEEKMTLFWHGHFTSGSREVKNPIFMKEQNDLLRRQCVGNFRNLVLGIAKDRAMLVYLDGRSNVKEHPNENFARELMELFTLGVGNYTEGDVKEAARAFTGWAFDDDGFQFRARQHDDGPKRFLGASGKFNGNDIVDIIVEQPACARWIATKLAKFFIRPEPDKALVDAIASELRKNKFELRPTMKTIFKSQAFYHESSRGALVKSPVELIVSSARKFGVNISNLRAAERAMAAMGQELMQPPNVKGWAGGEKWINAATLFNRYNNVSQLIQGGGGERKASRDEMTDEEMRQMHATDGKMEAKSRNDGGKQPAFDPMPAIREHSLDNSAMVVDYFSRMLLATPLSDDKHEALAAFLDNGKKFDPAAKNAAERVRLMVCLMCSTPEFQMQ